jgi:HEAT repeat protein
MAKGRSLESRLARLRLLRHEPPSPVVVLEVTHALRDPSNLVAAEAAEIAGEARLAELAPALVATFERFLDNPVKTDKLCRAKIAIVEALNKMDFAEEGFYLRGVRYLQMEPAWGDPVDTAVPLRTACAFALVRLRHRGVLALLVDMLTEKDKAARVGAVQALTYTATEAAALVLRLKASLGDPEAEVIGECFGGLLELTPEPAVPFVAEFLEGADEAIQEAALLALGSSRRAEALDVLRSYWEKATADLREVVCVALALLRLPAATDFLLQLVAGQPPASAGAALAALAVHRYDPQVRERAAAAVAANGQAALQAIFDKRFATKE